MARNRRGQPIHGWLIIDKPYGMSSAAVVGQVRRILDAAKAGHGGTLDPLATGVLPIALGEATKTVAYVMDGAKSYSFRIRWGEATASDDAEGSIIATSDQRPTEAEIRTALSGFLGEIQQTPPIFSAVKIGGRRAYELARAEQPVHIEPRTVRVDAFDLVAMPDADHADFVVRSGKGTYMRSLARDLALACGTVGHIAALRRTAVGRFTEQNAISLENLKELGHSAPSLDYLHPVETALDDIPALALTGAEADRLRTGQPLSLLRLAARNPLGCMVKGAVVCAMSEGKAVALARIEHGELRAVRVLNL